MKQRTRKSFLKILAVAAIALLGVGVMNAHATDFFVSTNGDDANLGTSKAPSRTIQHAANKAQPGDVITVHEGIYRERINDGAPTKITFPTTGKWQGEGTYADVTVPVAISKDAVVRLSFESGDAPANIDGVEVLK